MEHSFIQLNDLPDEILLIILKKLHNFDVLYSLIGVNKRLDTIVNDSIFTRNLTLITPFNGLSYQFTDTILDRFCLEILPKIHDKIEWLNVESSQVKQARSFTDSVHCGRIRAWTYTIVRRSHVIRQNTVVYGLRIRRPGIIYGTYSCSKLS